MSISVQMLCKKNRQGWRYSLRQLRDHQFDEAWTAPTNANREHLIEDVE